MTASYNPVKVNNLRQITTAEGVDELIINDLGPEPIETKKITAYDFAVAIKDYILPIATDSVLGGIKVGEGLTINPITGVLSNDITVITDLNDVTVTSPQIGHILRYDGEQWVNEVEGGFTNIIAGDGLSGGGAQGEVTLNVNAGEGIIIDRDAVTLNTGDGLVITNDKVSVSVSEGFTFVAGELTLVTGTGLNISDGQLNFVPSLGLIPQGGGIRVDIGEGLRFDGNKVAVNYIPEQADCAVDSTPFPDTRNYGVVKIASKEESEDKSNRCEVITPYTMWQAIPDFEHTRPDSVTVSIREGYNNSLCVDNPNLSLTAVGVAKRDDGKPAVGVFTYQWYETTGGGIAPLRAVRQDIVTGGSSDVLEIEDIVITPSTGSRSFKVIATYTDLYDVEYVAESLEAEVFYQNSLEINTQPQDLDLNSSVSGSFSVQVNSVDDDLPDINPSFKWFINNQEIAGSTTPDVGYTFNGFTTNTLTVNRTDSSAATYTIHCEIMGGCQGTLFSNSVLLQGPGSQSILPNIPTIYAVGSYLQVSQWDHVTFGQPGQLSPGATFEFRNGIPGTWMKMSTIVNDLSNDGPWPTHDILCLRIR